MSPFTFSNLQLGKLKDKKKKSEHSLEKKNKQTNLGTLFQSFETDHILHLESCDIFRFLDSLKSI